MAAVRTRHRTLTQRQPMPMPPAHGAVNILGRGLQPRIGTAARKEGFIDSLATLSMGKLDSRVDTDHVRELPGERGQSCGSAARGGRPLVRDGITDDELSTARKGIGWRC